MAKETKNKSVFGSFTNLYEVQKTLRFELKPVGETRDWMSKNLEYDDELRTFLKDQKIEDAYQTLKPVFDKIHEDFITASLESEQISEIDFSKYFEKYKIRKEIKEDEISKIEGILRLSFETIYKKQAEKFKDQAGKNDKGKDVLKQEGFSVLTESGILNYIKKIFQVSKI